MKFLEWTSWWCYKEWTLETKTSQCKCIPPHGTSWFLAFPVMNSPWRTYTTTKVIVVIMHNRCMHINSFLCEWGGNEETSHNTHIIIIKQIHVPNVVCVHSVSLFPWCVYNLIMYKECKHGEFDYRQERVYQHRIGMLVFCYDIMVSPNSSFVQKHLLVHVTSIKKQQCFKML